MRLRVEALTVRYPGRPEPALAGVSLDVAPGSLYAVLGPNGSGKSTLVRALLGMTPISAGAAFVGDRPARAWARQELARSIGVVTQREVIAFPLTTRELVAMGRYPHLGPLRAEGRGDRDAIERALRICDLEGLDTQDVSTLSGGELQRARIARALAQEPQALVLDEPTASLDVGHEMAILELLRTLAHEGTTVLLVTHGLDLAARFADQMLLLHRGAVAAEGDPSWVMRPEALSRAYEWPVAVHADPITGTPRITPLRSSPTSTENATRS